MFFERTIQSRIIQDDLNGPGKPGLVERKPNGVLHILRSKAIAYLVVFLETSSIHGLNHLVATGRHVFEILLWLTMVILSVYGSVSLSRTTWLRYQSSPTVVSMDRDMFAWNTTFPCVTICPHTRLDEKKLDLYVQTSPVEDKKALKSFIRTLANSTYKTFENITESFDPISPDEYLPLLVKLAAPFGPTLTIGASGINLKVQPTITEMGLCYTINSKVAEYNSPKYRDANRWDVIKTPSDTLFVHPLDGEVFAQVINLSTAYDVYIHGPLEVPDISTKFQHSGQDFYMKMYVTALTVYTSPEAAKLKVAQRRCRFQYENILKHNTIYTYTMCRMECRIRLCLKYCGCIPYFYRRIGDEKICNVTGMRCLANHTDELYKLEIGKDKKINCGCFPICEDVNYVIQSSVGNAFAVLGLSMGHISHFTIRWSVCSFAFSIASVLTSKVLIEGTQVLQPWFLGTNLQWGIVTYPRMRYRRDIIFGFTDVLVAVGSMAGLFLGCSVLSFMEIVYFLTLRLVFYTHDAITKT